MVLPLWNTFILFICPNCQIRKCTFIQRKLQMNLNAHTQSKKKTAKNYTWPTHTYTMFFPTSNISTLSHTINETFDCSEFSVRFNFVDGRSFAKCWFVCQIVHTHTQTRAQNNNETKKNWNARYCLICVVFWFNQNSGHFWVAHWILAFHILQTIYSRTHCRSVPFTHTLARSVILFDLESLSHCPFHFDVSFYIYLIRISLKWNWKTFFCCCCCRSVAVVIVVANDDFKYFFRALRPTLSHLYARTFTHRLIQMCVYNVRIVSAFHYGTHNFVEKWKQVASKSAQQQHSLDFIWIRFSDKLQTDLIGPNCFHLQKNPIETACSRWF